MADTTQHRALRAVGSTDTSGPETPEVLFLSALLRTGSFNPAKYQVTVEDFTCWKDLWHFCEGYQQREGCAPPLSLVALKFPTFEVADCGPDFASAEVIRAASAREMKLAMREATLKLDDHRPDPDAAYTALAAIRPRVSVKAPIDGLAPWLQEGEDEGVRIPVPFKSLQYVTNGIGRGEMILIGARPGEGKTHIASVFIAKAMAEGARVGLLSLEMPGASVRRRVMRALIGPNEADLRALAEPGLEHQRVLAKLRERTPGSLSIIDPSFGRITPNVVRGYLEEHDLVVIDHVGLLGTNAGGRAVEDWRNLGGISNQLIEDKLATGCPIIGLTQLNRNAEDGPKHVAPKKASVAGADTLVQDADVIITMRRMSIHVMTMGAVKNREGAPATWYTRFDPAKVRFDELTRDNALNMAAEDEAFL